MSALDDFEVRHALRATGVLREFNAIGVLAAADVHVAERLALLGGEEDELVVLAAALAVRAPRLGHVYVDLATIRETATVDADEPVDLSALPWPAPGDWLDRVRESVLVHVGERDAHDPRPLRLVDSALYLDRYWREEGQVADDLRALGQAEAVNTLQLEDSLNRLFDKPGAQRLAAQTAVERRFAVVAGGPGTGKTTTVARIVAALAEQGDELPLVALAAPTGKAATRLKEAVHAAALEMDVAPRVRDELLALNASTLHRLLGWKPGSHSRFRHDRGNRLPHDVVIVDETSMVSLTQMARLVEAVRPGARLVLVGDPGQLTSIEAGAVLGDIVGVRGPGVVELDVVHRGQEGIKTLAPAIRSGNADAAIEALRHGYDDITWIPVDVGEPESLAQLAPIREGAVAAATEVIEAARAGQDTAAMAALGAFRVLCAHRRGSHGVSVWTARIERWLGSAIGRGRWYPGRPLLVTKNDYGLDLYNGDAGVVVSTAPGKVSAVFERRGKPVPFAPSRLNAIETVYAMTVHKSQGSQFATAAVLLPAATSPILTRELLYTAITRANKRLILAGTEETIRAAVARPVARASGLGRRLA
ncbi:exodeoxyribonuclease V subunit alpha [Solirubrobacter phytolaccae]|uniref:RecBCD enzyme subunit RecD n=1 Tax=Solirubrobacter phytolaccae TaxID=1404360 RepID=A0A9X3N3K6_9ACTN|nr:exodeoxyribonuclease V subunit alpha [Solirubrobacter phytolaccae]MDA0178831.1 exodeoxyribonuclease V subunit alpha [Solirubrobacter phytolaccae]